MSIIEEFLEQYNRQYDFYTELARIGSNQLEQELAKRGIKAIVSYRAKKPDRLKAKLEQRNKENPYKNVASVFDDIVDLAGVRVALYFPSDRELVDEIIKEIFNVKKMKKFPGESHVPKFNKRFSGYWASHYRVNVTGVEKSRKRYESALFEIQVASVLMHAWSEVEHDLVYKPLSGDLSEEEYAILDEINGLVITGEIALERLQKAMTKRTNESNRINNRYELTSLITSSLNKNYLKKLKLGDTKILFNYLKDTEGFSADKFNDYISRVNQSEKETISDQLFTMILDDTYSDIKNKNYLEKYFERSLGTARDYSGFESFVKTWIVLEKAVTHINREHNKRHKKFFTAKFEHLVELELISSEEALELNDFRRIRNNLLHGFETPPDNELSAACTRLIELTNKVVESIKDATTKDTLSGELVSIRENKHNK
ncbi:RelA/SpoT protein [Vibrio parahaemolyticus]|uniref:GTP pyrophosphokinase n=1 Tax=Vibrio harveyi group TaxID=717610 RepID=UPI000A3AB9C8|nr:MULTISPECIES: RelA/SpoT domain-containing protein [Vibrio harveyi group]EGQ8161853.1 RelA/SpoT domain-containing protein [Vibrio parahaemolyticus]EGQ8289213.1 RelA/SpoT protein [Vibrio parahaemolyticus]EGQ8326220.1 RelA/SpoT protein [Vibrio parahaemolyticus]EGQ8354929.1 RelA/SpoT protein [Vibrio parahaemolyticus]EGQ8775588.1 RelA/SpoT protein [Vibrio parahaemolyticus]